MEYSAPKLLPIPFADQGVKNDIPENNTDPSSNAASYTTGFKPITMTPRAAGGKPPQGQDFNGIFNDITENIRYLNAGGQYRFNADFVAAIGGYPAGAVLQSDDGLSLYVSLVDDNTENFNTADPVTQWMTVVAQATETDAGVARIATAEEASAGTSNDTIITPVKLANALAGKVNLSDFTGSNQSFSGTGYQKFPGGLIVQWGEPTSSTSGDLRVNFPIPFPNYCAVRLLTPKNGTGSNAVFAVVGAYDLTGLSFGTYNYNGTRSLSSIDLIAIGW